MSSGLNPSRRLLLAVFAVSGFSGLIYESIWSHYLKLFLGHAAYAQTLVLAIFMGGMAIGSALVARYAGRLRNLLLGYALVEAATGILALCFHQLHLAATSMAFNLVIPALGSPAAIALFKWSLAAAMILPQSVLLGATFPLISGGVIRRYPQRPGATLAMLYFTNSLGAAVGVLASGFWLIGAVGLPGTVMTAGLLNLALACLVWLLTRSAPEPLPLRSDAAAAGGARAAPRTVRWLLLAAAAAGLAAFMYEIAWIRMLSLVLGASTHAFELMLSAFILGLALGGYWVRRRIDQLRDPLWSLAWMFALMAGCAVLTLPAYGTAFDLMAAALRMFGTTNAGYAGFNVVSQVIAAAMMLPTTIVAGMTLPVMTHWLYTSGAGERAIGQVYAANTLGAIAGVMIAVHLLMPLTGTKGLIIGAAAVQLCVAGMFMQRSGSGAVRHRWRRVAVLAGSGALVCVVAVLVRLDPMRMASGVYRTGAASLSPETVVSYFRDGKTATISLARFGTTVYIATNGKTDAAINMGSGPNTSDEVTMTLLGALPLLMHPQARRIANIGIGSGLTSQVLLASSALQQLDSIEIEPAVAAAARLGFGPRVERLFSDARSHIHFEDAKSFFAGAGRQYDVIVSEPSNPWVSGVATLFSDEYYRDIQRYLAADGLFVQWLQIYETDMSVVASVLKALAPHFGNYVVYNTDDTDIVIVASRQHELPALSAAGFATPALASELERVGIHSLAQLELRRIGTQAELDPLMASYAVPPNSDFFPYVDLNAPRMRFLGREAMALSRLQAQAVPVARLLGDPSAPELPAGAWAASDHERERRTGLAGELLRAMASGELAALPVDDARNVLILRAPPPACSDAGARAAWATAVYSMSSQTTPFVPAVRMSEFWARVRGSLCYRTAAAGERRWLDFQQLLAAADASAVARAGLALLQAPDSTLTGQQLADLLVATSAALLGAGRAAEASALLRAWRPSLRDPGRYELTLRWLAALADTPARRAPAAGR